MHEQRTALIRPMLLPPLIVDSGPANDGNYAERGTRGNYSTCHAGHVPRAVWAMTREWFGENAITGSERCLANPIAVVTFNMAYCMQRPTIAARVRVVALGCNVTYRQFYAPPKTHPVTPLSLR